MLKEITASESLTFLNWIKENKLLAVVIVLCIVIGYLYVNGRKDLLEKDTKIELLQTTIRNMEIDALRIERERTARMEFLLNNLPKPNGDPK